MIISYIYFRIGCPMPVQLASVNEIDTLHDDVIKWKHFPRYWPFVRVINRSPVNSTHKGQWRGALMFPLIYRWLSKQSGGWWFETLLRPLWRHWNEYTLLHTYVCEERCARSTYALDTNSWHRNPHMCWPTRCTINIRQCRDIRRVQYQRVFNKRTYESSIMCRLAIIRKPATLAVTGLSPQI